MDSDVALFLLGLVVAVWGARKLRNRIVGAPRQPEAIIAAIVGLAMIVLGGAQFFRDFSAAAGGPWVTFRSASDHYSVTFPVAPQTSAKDHTVHGHVFHENHAEVKTGEDQLLFEVIIADLAPASLGPDALKTTITGILLRARNTIDRGPLKLSQTPGWEWAFAEPGAKVRTRMRIFVVGSRVYKVTVVGTEDQIMSAQATRFLDSFAFENLDRLPASSTQPSTQPSSQPTSAPSSQPIG